MNDVLDRINADKRTHVAARKSAISENQLLIEAKSAPRPRGFINALENTVAGGGFGLIAEIKKASPSKGLIREDFEPLELARAYQRGGATCLSVLTDVPYFQGRDEYLNLVCGAVDLPAIRKDFMVDPYQIIESRALGADCVLLIMASLDDALAGELHDLASELEMDSLVEIHNEAEMERALRLSPKLLGINNRNLKTLEVDLAATERLAPLATGDVTLVCESGLYTHHDLERMSKAGTNCFLVGESLMRQDDVEHATRTLLGKAS